MPNAEPTAGPRFDQLTTGGAGPGSPAEGQAPVAAGPPTFGGVMTNDGAKEAIMTNPLQAARIRAEASRDRLRKLAIDLATQRHAPV